MSDHWPWWNVEIKASTTELGKVEIAMPDQEPVSVGATAAAQMADNLQRAADEARICARRGPVEASEALG